MAVERSKLELCDDIIMHSFRHITSIGQTNRGLDGQTDGRICHNKTALCNAY